MIGKAIHITGFWKSWVAAAWVWCTRPNFINNNILEHVADLHFLSDSYMGVPIDESRKALGEAMGDYWVQFAATGNPNRPGLPQWPAYDPKTDQLLELGEKIRVRTGFRKEVCDLFDKVYEAKAAKYKQRPNNKNAVK